MNQLQHETSPYLLQHAHNPVDWYAWKPEAFERAKAEQKPILVSIGYSTCHWCHVMERESFENEDIAAFMNERFINIKVDREERPDVDAIYMEACQILTGGGGWPLNCFLTPDSKPFYAGTYFPPRPAHNRPSWLQLLQHLANIWETQREVAEEQAEKLLGHIKRNDDLFIKQTPLAAPAPPSPPIRGGAVDSSVESTPNFSEIPSNTQTDAPVQSTELSTAPPRMGGLGGAGRIFFSMRERFDRTDGGFGGAPKFPSTMAIKYLLDFHHFTGNSEALEHAQLSLDKMIHGGIYDQLGGGFARYATDREWLVPHFEKMLYDNALLVTVLSDAYKATRRELYKETIEETLAYIKREMTHPEGGFYSAQDADSEGVEGKFFVWDKAEIEQILGDEAELFCTFYDVSEHGNWEEKNILWRLEPHETFAAGIKMDLGLLKSKLKTCREKLFTVREARIHPGLDDKILLGWNALQCSAYVSAFTALGHEEYRAAAIRNIDFLLTRFEDPSSTVDGGSFTVDRPPSTVYRPPSTVHRLPSTVHRPPSLFHVWKNGHAQYAAFLEDYAFLIAALVDVYQISFDVSYLQIAEKYTQYVLSYFKDTETGMFFITNAGQSDIVLRKKDLYDNATPSGNSTMVHNLQRLGILLDRRDWRENASAMLWSMKDSVERYPLSFERWATTMMNEEYPIQEIAIVGANAPEKALLLQGLFVPNMVIAATTEPMDDLPLLAGKPGADDALIYVCRDFSCQRPVTTLAEFSAMK